MTDFPFLDTGVGRLVKRLAKDCPSGPCTGGSNLRLIAGNFRLVIENVFRFLGANRPSTPLNDAQLGGYFFAQITRGMGIAA